jgi:hypothetical protein|tara:strand:- start:5990 stop:6505 length:516 start_codon:yes stop_codon:yes gene_type:complete
MKREYSSGTSEDVIYFTGFEVEKTPAFDKDTLFVVGCRPLEEVLEQAKKHYVDHIYLGANQSFVPKEDWEDLVNGLLNKKYLVTLDYDVKYHDWVIEMGFNQNQNFISQISVKLPHIKELNYNACIKIDDADFDHSNAGVWIHQVHDLLDRDKFTDWTKYNDDNPADEVDK